VTVEPPPGTFAHRVLLPIFVLAGPAVIGGRLTRRRRGNPILG
jgi:hypothetical protein